MLDRTLVVVESEELLRGQKRGIAVALRKAREELRKLERRAASGRIQREALEERVRKALRREHLSEFVVAAVKEERGKRIASLARRCGATATAGAYAPGPAGLVYRSSSLEHRPNRACFSRPMERGGTIPSGQEGWRGALGAFPSVGRQFVAIAHVRHGDRFDAW